MPVDATIALGLKPVQVKSQTEYMNELYTMRNAEQLNQMNQMRMEEANRVHGADIAFKNALRRIGDPNSPEGQLETDRAYFNAGLGDKRAAMRASEESSRKAFNEEQKQLMDESNAAHREISSDPTDERIAERNRQIQNDRRFNTSQKAEAADNAGRLINIPYEQRKLEMAQSGATVAERKPSIIQQNTGSHVNVVSIPSSGGAPNILSSTPMGLNPDQQLGVPVGYTEGSASLDARNKSLNAKLAELSNPNTTLERAKALEGEIQQDRRSLSAHQQDQESMRLAAQQAKQPLDAKEKQIKDYYAELKKGRSPDDPEMKELKKLIDFGHTHPSQEPVDPRKVTHSTQSEKGDIINLNAYGKVVSVIKEGGKPSAQFAKTKEQNKALGKNIDIAISSLTEAIKLGGLLDQSTHSGIGRGIDIAGNVFGQETTGGVAAARLAPIADLALKVVPRFEGPQSDADVISYQKAAGDLANPNLGINTRRAAAVTVIEIMKKRKAQFVTPEMAAQGEAPAGGGNPHAGKTDAQIKAELGI